LNLKENKIRSFTQPILAKRIFKKKFMKKSAIGILAFVAFIWGCKKEITSQAQVSQSLTGSWEYSTFIDSIYVYDKEANLVDNKLGFTLNENGTFIERKINGWCATPPVSLSDYNGTWSIKDSTIFVSVGYWGGIVDYTWKIKSLKNSQLKIVIKDIIYHPSIN